MMTANDLIDQISKLYPSFSAEVDEEGQLIFYTGLYEYHDGTLVFREGDESEVDE